MNAAQLKGDLKHIEGAVERADVPQATKRLLGEILEWNRGMVDQTFIEAARIDALEGAVDDLLEGVGEGILPETAQVILTALEQARHVCATIAAFLESDKNPLDEVTTKSFAMLILGCSKSVAVAKETITDIIIEEEDVEDEDEGTEDEGTETVEGTEDEVEEENA
jgi:hypothetical protein